MCEQIAEGDVPHGGLGHYRAVAAAGEHTLACEVGQVPRDRVIKLELTLLVEHHDRDGGQRFGHRIDAVNGFGRSVGTTR